MKARLMLAALSWNALQRSNATEKVDVVKWSKRKGAWVLEERRKKQASDSVPPQLKSLMSRVVEVASQHLQLPPIAEPKLQRRGCHVAKPSKEELRHLWYVNHLFLSFLGICMYMYTWLSSISISLLVQQVSQDTFFSFTFLLTVWWYYVYLVAQHINKLGI